jgi:hypothetical protein
MPRDVLGIEGLELRIDVRGCALGIRERWLVDGTAGKVLGVEGRAGKVVGRSGRFSMGGRGGGTTT